MMQGEFGQGRGGESQQASEKPLKMAMGDTFRVYRYDARNWILEFWVKGGRSPKTREIVPDHWDFGGYYGQLSDVAHHLLNRSVVFADGTSGQQVLDAITEAEKSITKALKAVLQNAL